MQLIQTRQQLQLDTLAAQQQVILPPRLSRAFITPRVAKPKPVPWYWYQMDTGHLYTSSNAWRILTDPWLEFGRQAREHTPEWMNKVIDFSFMAFLMDYADKRTPGVHNLTDEQKEAIFEGNSTLGAGILLDEFARGTGPEHRLFTPGGDQMARDFLTGYVLDGVRNGLYREVNDKKITYEMFLKRTKSLSYGLPFSPDHTETNMESLEKHFESNPIQFFIAGANIRVCPSNVPDDYIEVEIKNATTRNSAMGHIPGNYKRSNGRRPLSTIHQRFRFKLKIDPNRFPKK